MRNRLLADLACSLTGNNPSARGVKSSSGKFFEVESSR